MSCLCSTVSLQRGISKFAGLAPKPAEACLDTEGPDSSFRTRQQHPLNIRPSGMFSTIPRHQQPLPLLFFGGGDEQSSDGSRYNPTVIQFLKDDWVHKQLQLR